jgi:type II secretion system protein H
VRENTADLTGGHSIFENAFAKASEHQKPPELCSSRRQEAHTISRGRSQHGLNLRQADAFTLMELMVVIVLISIMTALIIPEMKGTYEDALLRSTGRELAEAFALASSRAVSQNQSHRVQLDAHSGRYLVERKTRLGGQEIFVPLKDVSGSEGKLDPRIAVEIRHPGEMTEVVAGEPPPSGDNQPSVQPDSIAFNPDGTADAIEILLRDRAGFQLVLQLNPVTARVHIVEPKRE